MSPWDHESRTIVLPIPPLFNLRLSSGVVVLWSVKVPVFLAGDYKTQHNPAAQRDPVSGTFLLYYMGSTDNGTDSTGGGKCATRPEQQTLCNQRVGLAKSASPAGPWIRGDKPIVEPGPAGAWDSQFTTNPTPLLLSNGSVLLVYKAR